MKKALKIGGIVLGALLVLILGFAVFVNARGIPTYEVPQVEYQAVASPEALARGKKLVSMLCAGCHMDPKTRKLTGTQMLDAPEEFGVIYSQNITQDKTHGIGNWTDAELLVLLRTGLKPDGQYVPPYMAKLPHMADSDINAIIAFLRSDDPLVAADPTPDQPTDPSFLTKLLCNVAFKPFEMPAGPIEMPDTTDKIALGRYLVYNLECFSCHSADFKSNDSLNPENSAGYLGGGNPTLDLEGRIIPTANLTPHPETGIGNWTEEQFIRAVKYGIVPRDEPALRYPMQPYALLTDHEASAIYAYLQTVEPIDNQVERIFYDQ